MIEYQPRRPLEDSDPHGYQESAKDYVANNVELAVYLLDKYGPEIYLDKVAKDA